MRIMGGNFSFQICYISVFQSGLLEYNGFSETWLKIEEKPNHFKIHKFDRKLGNKTKGGGVMPIIPNI